MNYSLESKDILAKLMATENINIVHQKISTAMFDPKSRTLYCPIWKDMSNELRDLLLGHETGHALETPADGWHNAVSSRGKNYKAFLNVVEDARIEKKIKRRYPGLKRSFIQGYHELLDRDFFGIKNSYINDLPFIDRLNLYTKGGITLGIEFNDEETSLLNEVVLCETWDDVLRVTEKIYNYSKTEQHEMQQKTVQPSMSNPYDDDGDEYDDFDEGDEVTESEKNNAERTKTEETDGEDEEKNNASSENSDEESESTVNEKSDDSTEKKSDEKSENEEYGSRIERFKQTKNYDGPAFDFEPVCETDNAFRQNEILLVEQKSIGLKYLNLPKPILKNIIVPHKKVHKTLTAFYAQHSLIDELVNKFKSKNDRYISLLAKEFEMRKAASKFAKTKISSTGDLDVNKVYKYKLDDNIFKKMMHVPKGKSHGLILLLDYSGSMKTNMESSIEQILIISMFCRKVNIPFVVYSFGNSTHARQHDFNSLPKSFERKYNDLVLSDVSLREYLNSSMSNSEFKNAIRNMIALKSSFNNRSYPLSEKLSNTPLIEAMIAIKPVTIDFKMKNNLDIVNLVVVHDGDADYSQSYYDENLHEQHLYTDFIINDTETRYQFSIKNVYYSRREVYELCDDLRGEIFDWYKQNTGAKIFGFFLIGNRSEAKNALMTRYRNQKGLTILDKPSYQKTDRYVMKNSPVLKQKIDELYKDKFIISYSKGYNEFYFIPGGNNLNLNDDEFEIEGKVTVNKLKTAFLKFNKKRQVNRVFVSKFIEGIAV